MNLDDINNNLLRELDAIKRRNRRVKWIVWSITIIAVAGLVLTLTSCRKQPDNILCVRCEVQGAVNYMDTCSYNPLPSFGDSLVTLRCWRR